MSNPVQVVALTTKERKMKSDGDKDNNNTTENNNNGNTINTSSTDRWNDLHRQPRERREEQQSYASSRRRGWSRPRRQNRHQRKEASSTGPEPAPPPPSPHAREAPALTTTAYDSIDHRNSNSNSPASLCLFDEDLEDEEEIANDNYAATTRRSCTPTILHVRRLKWFSKSSLPLPSLSPSPPNDTTTTTPQSSPRWTSRFIGRRTTSPTFDKRTRSATPATMNTTATSSPTTVPGNSSWSRRRWRSLSFSSHRVFTTVDDEPLLHGHMDYDHVDDHDDGDLDELDEHYGDPVEDWASLVCLSMLRLPWHEEAEEGRDDDFVNRTITPSSSLLGQWFLSPQQRLVQASLQGHVQFHLDQLATQQRFESDLDLEPSIEMPAPPPSSLSSCEEPDRGDLSTLDRCALLHLQQQDVGAAMQLYKDALELDNKKHPSPQQESTLGAESFRPTLRRRGTSFSRTTGAPQSDVTSKDFETTPTEEQQQRRSNLLTRLSFLSLLASYGTTSRQNYKHLALQYSREAHDMQQQEHQRQQQQDHGKRPQLPAAAGLMWMGLVHVGCHRHGQAVKALRQALQQNSMVHADPGKHGTKGKEKDHGKIQPDFLQQTTKSKQGLLPYHALTAVLLNNLGVLHGLTKEAAASSLRALQESALLQQDLLKQMTHPNQVPPALFRLAITLANLAWAYHRGQRLDRAIAVLEEARSLMESLGSADMEAMAAVAAQHGARWARQLQQQLEQQQQKQRQRAASAPPSRGHGNRSAEDKVVDTTRRYGTIDDESITLDDETVDTWDEAGTRHDTSPSLDDNGDDPTSIEGEDNDSDSIYTHETERSSAMFGNEDGIPHRRVAAQLCNIQASDSHDYWLLGPLMTAVEWTAEERVRESVWQWLGKEPPLALYGTDPVNDSNIHNDIEKSSPAQDELSFGPEETSVVDETSPVPFVAFDRFGSIPTPDRSVLQDAIPIDPEAGYVINAELYLNQIHRAAMQHLDHHEVDDAADLFRSCLRSHEAKYGPNHHLVGSAWHNLGMVFLFARSYAKAQDAFERAVRVRTTALGSHHPDVALSQTKLVLVSLAQGHWDTAESILQTIRHNYQQLLGSKHPLLPQVYNNLGLLAYQRGETDYAAQLLRKADQLQSRWLLTCPATESATTAPAAGDVETNMNHCDYEERPPPALDPQTAVWLTLASAHIASNQAFVYAKQILSCMQEEPQSLDPLLVVSHGEQDIDYVIESDKSTCMQLYEQAARYYISASTTLMSFGSAPPLQTRLQLVQHNMRFLRQQWNLPSLSSSSSFTSDNADDGNASGYERTASRYIDETEAVGGSTKIGTWGPNHSESNLSLGSSSSPSSSSSSNVVLSHNTADLAMGGCHAFSAMLYPPTRTATATTTTTRAVTTTTTAISRHDKQVFQWSTSSSSSPLCLMDLF